MFPRSFGARAGTPAIYLVLGGGCFLATMLLCCLLEPSREALRIGLSYYGNSLTTLPPYLAGFVLCIAMSARGLARVPQRHDAGRRLRRAVGFVLALMILIPITPYRLDIVFDWLHIGAATLLFAAGLLLGLWLTFRFRRSRNAKLWFALEAMAGVSIFAAQLGFENYMIPSELTFHFSLLGLIVHSVRGLPS